MGFSRVLEFVRCFRRVWSRWREFIFCDVVMSFVVFFFCGVVCLWFV